MFRGWLELDEHVLQFKQDERRIGFGYVCWYILDMCQAHYRNFGRRKELMDIIKANKTYADIVNSSNRYTEMREHPTIFQIKNYIIGIAMSAIKIAKRTYIMKKIKIKKKYRCVNNYI